MILVAAVAIGAASHVAGGGDDQELSATRVATTTFSLVPGAGKSVDAATALRDGYGSATFTLGSLPVGNSLYGGVQVRADAAGKSEYVGKIRVYPSGALNVGISKVIDGVENRLTAVSTKQTVRAGQSVRVEVRISGTSPVSIGARAWVLGTDRPRWQVSATDSTASKIVASGKVRATVYLSSGATAPISVTVRDVGSLPAGTGTPVTSPPAPSPTTPAPPSATATAPSTPASPPASPTTSPTGSPAGAKPGPSNTGVPDGTSLTVYNGNLTITQPGATYDSLDIRGRVSIKAPNVTIRRSLIRGDGTGFAIVANTNSAGTNFVIEDSTIRPDTPTTKQDGFAGGNVTMRRVDISGTCDGAKFYHDDVLAQGNWIHGLTRGYDASQPDKITHNDSFQLEGGSNTRIIGNNLQGGLGLIVVDGVEAGTNSAIQVTQNVTLQRGLVIADNWMDYGACSLNLSDKGKGHFPLTLTDNRFGRNTRLSDCAVTGTSTTILTASGNVWDDTGQPVRLRQ